MRNALPTRSARRRRRGRRGFALLAVLVFSIAGLIFVAISQRHIAAAVNAERNLVLRDDYQEGAVEAMAVAIEQLEAREPSTALYTCYTDVTTSMGVKSYSITYTNTAPSQWIIDVQPYSGTSLPMMPNLLP